MYEYRLSKSDVLVAQESENFRRYYDVSCATQDVYTLYRFESSFASVVVEKRHRAASYVSAFNDNDTIKNSVIYIPQRDIPWNTIAISSI